ncbi:MAG: 23S rRNA (pseudouridine(1915)-N(3))-methyltransferase RlmH [Pseudomonadota bacterium]|nr:23S rRNA (pseudouridine(1915)-N(3))-methyltransferase RlmH [Pseudomonadota bacterium]
MRIGVVAVGRLGRAPEAALAQDYLKRATAAGRALGLGPFDLAEVESRRPGKAFEGAALLAAAAPDAHRIALDERGRPSTSRAFAERLGGLRDCGVRRVEFLIGGADGLPDEVRESAAELLAFGPQTWPHALVRLMLAEQLYRAVTILAGSPYHRD